MKRLAVPLALALALSLPVVAAAAKTSCELAAEKGGWSAYYNIQCMYDLLTGWL